MVARGGIPVALDSQVRAIVEGGESSLEQTIVRGCGVIVVTGDDPGGYRY